MNYLYHIGIMIGIYGMLAYSTNLLTGFGGLMTMTQAAFYGMGAYVSWQRCRVQSFSAGLSVGFWGWRF